MSNIAATSEVRARLRSDISKWKAAVLTFHREIPAGLCELYLKPGDSCEGCPVMAATGKNLCKAVGVPEFVSAWVRHKGFEPDSKHRVQYYRDMVGKLAIKVVAGLTEVLNSLDNGGIPKQRP